MAKLKPEYALAEMRKLVRQVSHHPADDVVLMIQQRMKRDAPSREAILAEYAAINRESD